jgi:AcrR family transcriptional regulator
MSERTRQAERSQATRAALTDAARDLFAERGYAGVGTEEIVKRARVTRGALYHHFEDKKDLFRAVHESMEEGLVAAIGEQIQGIDDPVELLTAGVRAFLDACEDPALARIALIDAPSVLGWEEWREIDARHGMGLVMFGLHAAMDAGAIRPQPVKPLAHLLLSAMGEAGIMIATADDPAAARAEVEASLLSVLQGLSAS